MAEMETCMRALTASSGTTMDDWLLLDFGRIAAHWSGFQTRMYPCAVVEKEGASLCWYLNRLSDQEKQLRRERFSKRAEAERYFCDFMDWIGQDAGFSRSQWNKMGVDELRPIVVQYVKNAYIDCWWKDPQLTEKTPPAVREAYLQAAQDMEAWETWHSELPKEEDVHI